MAVVPLDHLRVRAADLRDAKERRPGVDEVGDGAVPERIGGSPQRQLCDGDGDGDGDGNRPLPRFFRPRLVVRAG